MKLTESQWMCNKNITQSRISIKNFIQSSRQVLSTDIDSIYESGRLKMIAKRAIQSKNKYCDIFKDNIRFDLNDSRVLCVKWLNKIRNKYSLIQRFISMMSSIFMIYLLNENNKSNSIQNSIFKSTFNSFVQIRFKYTREYLFSIKEAEILWSAMWCLYLYINNNGFWNYH